MLSLIHVLEWRAAVHPGAIALSDQQGAELTYAGLADAVDRSAAGFAAAGIAPGHVVPVLARNQAGWVTAMLGLIRAGALPAAVNWRLAAPEVAALLRLACPAAVLADTDCAALARQAAAGLDRPVPILDLAGQQPLADGARPAAGGAQPDPPERPVSRLHPSEPAILVHTSGTTGLPKLVPLTHQQLIAAVVFMKLEERGEIQVRGAAPLPGYWNDPEATARSLTADGFYRTGDVGTLGADGYLTIVDRLSDLVITGGENVYPAEVEAVLAGHPAVADVAVIGIPDERWGETVHAIVVLAPGDTARANGDAAPGFDAAALVSWTRERLAGFKCPTGVTVVPELPRNATGKVVRAKLRAPFWTGRDRQVS